MGFLRSISTKETDEELLRNYQKTGQSIYFGKLYNRYIPLVYGLCLKYLQREDEAQDAVMQLFDELLTKVKQNEIQTFRTWLYSVARNHCLQILRKREHAVQIEIRPDFMESDEILHLLDEGDDDDGRMKALQHCMDRLPEDQRVAIAKFFMDGLSYADIVEATGYPLKSVKSYIQNGKRNLKICIEGICSL